MSEYSLKQIAQLLDLKLKGDDAQVIGLNTLEAAGENEISFLANPRYAHLLESTKACAVIVDEAHAPKVKRALISNNPYLDFARTLALFARKEGTFKGISELSFIDKSASLGENCTVYPFAYISARAQIGKNTVLFAGVYIAEDAKIGDNCVIYPNAVILSKVEIGNNCTIHPGAIIGAEGYGFTRSEAGIQKIPQAGFVKIGDNVDIGANTAVDRGALGPTTIDNDSKLDNLVQIGHNVQVGKEALIISQVGIAGSTKIGNRVTLAGQAGIAGHLNIGSDVTIGPQAGVPKDVPNGFKGGNTPLVGAQTMLRTYSIMPKLPDMYKRLNKMEKELSLLKEKLSKFEE